MLQHITHRINVNARIHKNFEKEKRVLVLRRRVRQKKKLFENKLMLYSAVRVHRFLFLLRNFLCFFLTRSSTINTKITFSFQWDLPSCILKIKLNISQICYHIMYTSSASFSHSTLKRQSYKYNNVEKSSGRIMWQQKRKYLNSK